jgi:hypothetical protein
MIFHSYQKKLKRKSWARMQENCLDNELLIHDFELDDNYRAGGHWKKHVQCK